MKKRQFVLFILILISLLFVVGCAPGNERFTENAAGFWAGLWHGMICIITFIISLFSDKVRVYELNNAGHLYDFGFILGIIIGPAQCGFWKSKKKKIHVTHSDEEWEEIGKKVEIKVKKGILNWLDETDKDETDWEKIGKKVEEKIKRELKTRAEKE